MEKASGLVTIYALLNRIRLNASEEVIQAAEHTIQNIIESYGRPNYGPAATPIRQVISLWRVQAITPRNGYLVGACHLLCAKLLSTGANTDLNEFCQPEQPATTGRKSGLTPCN
jgi:hypothetical protein